MSSVHMKNVLAPERVGAVPRQAAVSFFHRATFVLCPLSRRRTNPMLFRAALLLLSMVLMLPHVNAQPIRDSSLIVLDPGCGSPSFDLSELAEQIAPHVEYRDWALLDSSTRALCLAGTEPPRYDTFPRRQDRVAANVQLGLVAWQRHRAEVIHEYLPDWLQSDVHWALLALRYETLEGNRRYGLVLVMGTDVGETISLVNTGLQAPNFFG